MAFRPKTPIDIYWIYNVKKAKTKHQTSSDVSFRRKRSALARLPSPQSSFFRESSTGSVGGSVGGSAGASSGRSVAMLREESVEARRRLPSRRSATVRAPAASASAALARPGSGPPPCSAPDPAGSPRRPCFAPAASASAVDENAVAVAMQSETKRAATEPSSTGRVAALQPSKERSSTRRVATEPSSTRRVAAMRSSVPLAAIEAARRKAQIIEDTINQTRCALHSLNKKLFPLEQPDLPHFLISSKIRPTSIGVSGDLFDILPLPGDSMSFGVLLTGGDSYFLASKVQSALLAPSSPLRRKSRPTTEEVLVHLFQDLSPSFLKEERARAFFGIINRRDLRFRYSCFGSSLSAWIKPLNGPARPLSLKPPEKERALKKNRFFLSGQKLLQPGDVTALCSSGLAERVNPKGEFLGAPPLLKILNSESAADPLSLRQRLLFEAESFAEGAPSRQDQTVVVIGVKKRILKLAS